VLLSRDKYISVYGYFAKYTGALTYLSWTLLLIIIATNSRAFNSSKILIWFNRSGYVVITYGVIQFLDIDPIQWEELNSGVFSTLGNPNFFGAFSGIFFAYKFAELFSEIGKLVIWKITFLAVIMFVGLQSESLQFGIIVATGVLLILILRFRESKVFAISTSLILIFLTPFGVTGLFGRGPFSSILFQESNIYRWDYWRVAISQFTDKPFFGQGIELYGQYFRSFRDLAQVNSSDINHTSDSAHNLIFHSLAVGGLSLTLPFIAILSLVALKIFRDFREVPSLDKKSIIEVIWILLLFQNLISVDNIALSTWSWIFAGFILQKQKTPDTQASKALKIKLANVPKNEVTKLYSLTAKSMLIAFSAFWLLYGPTMSQIEMRKIFFQPAVDSMRGTIPNKELLIERVIEKEPENLFNYRLGANTLFIDKNYEGASKFASMGAKSFPDDYVVWWFWAKSLEERGKFEEAIGPREMTIKLDPQNYSNYYLQGLNYLALGDMNAARKMRDHLKTLAHSSSEYMDLNSKISK
jgi:tetratricopeptide (TPR) repeat protein